MAPTLNKAVWQKRIHNNKNNLSDYVYTLALARQIIFSSKFSVYPNQLLPHFLLLMTSYQTQLVQQTFSQVATLPVDVVGSLFYNRLFIIAPEVKSMFSRTTTPEQSRKLLTMLSYIVSRLDQSDQLVNEVEKLAQRHVRYGVQDRHYDQVGDALLWTLEQGLGEAWTVEVKEAWIACYTLLSGVMLRASSQVAVEL